jgi:predicted amino acid racemase
LEIDLDKIHHNARVLVEWLSVRGMAVTGITKATLGSPEIAQALLRAGVSGLGDSRIENIEAMRRAAVPGPMTLIRSPMRSQVERVVASADISCNTEVDVLRGLSAAAARAGRTHGIVLMVELGDLREGIMPEDVPEVVAETLELPSLVLRGIGANLACQSGVAPDHANMGELSALADAIEAMFGIALDIVSGGNSGNLEWALGATATGRINDLRLGESILLGRETLHRQPLDGLHTDAITLVAEVIESRVKPSQPWGDIAETAFGPTPTPTPTVRDRGRTTRTIVAVGQQDVDPSGLRPPRGVAVLGASSDHLILDPGGHHFAVGAEIGFQLNYSALLRAMTSPFVHKVTTRSPLVGSSHARQR